MQPSSNTWSRQAPVQTASVSTIDYFFSGGAGGDKNLRIYLQVVDQAGIGVSATITAQLYFEDILLLTSAKSSTADGAVSRIFGRSGAGAGCYSVKVIDVSAIGYVWAEENSSRYFCKP